MILDLGIKSTKNPSIYFDDCKSVYRFFESTFLILLNSKA